MNRTVRLALAASILGLFGVVAAQSPTLGSSEPSPIPSNSGNSGSSVGSDEIDHGHDHPHVHVHEEPIPQKPESVRIEDAEAVVAMHPEIDTVEDALRVLDHQERMDEVIDQIRAELGDEAIAGVYHEGDGSDTTVMTTGDGENVRRILARLGKPTVHVSPGWDLSAEKYRMEIFTVGLRLSRDGGVDNFGISTDLKTHKATVYVAKDGVSARIANEGSAQLLEDTADAIRSVQSRKDKPVEITIEIVDMQVFEDLDETGYGGDGLHSSTHAVNCTTAFSVKKGGTRGMLTAQHCGWGQGLPQSTNHYHHQGTSTHPTSAFGNKGQHNGVLGDMKWFTMTGIERPYFYYKNGAVRDVTSFKPLTNMDPGDIVFNFGRKTNANTLNGRSAVVADTNHWNNGVGSLVRVDRNLAQEGDSGGPWFNGRKAWGIHKGNAGTGPCPTCDTFTPVSTALGHFGLTIETL